MSIWLNNRGGSGQALLSVRVEKANGDVVDLAAAGDVMHAGAGGLNITEAGRQTELSRLENAVLSCTIDNTGGDYTPGYASAPTSMYQGMPIAVRETVGRRSWDLFTGTLNQPEAVYASGLLDATVQVTAIDWSGGQAEGRTFISNLGEWIVYHGGDTLAEYWPMTEAARPWLPVKNASSPPIVSRVFASSAEPADGFARITPAAGDMPLGEDARIPVIGGPLDSGGIPAFAYHLGVDWYDVQFTTPLPPIAVGEVVTVVAWVDPVEFSSLQEIFRVVLGELPGGGTTLLTLTKPSAGAAMVLEATGGALTGTITGSGLETGHGAYPIALRHGTTAGVFELWQGRKRFTGSLTGTPPAGGYEFGNCASGAFWYQGSVGHIQLYIGAEAEYTFTDYLAQIDHAENPITGGYRWQRTDERIRTAARYAGLADAQLDLDRGVAYLERASLAGKTFTQVRDEAVATEQGRCFTGGDGNLRFHNRPRTRYSV